MLQSLLIKNFRAFEYLEIPSLSRVNLITGKNNTGKTCLLEAIYLFANLGSQSAVRQILHDRDELPLHYHAQHTSEVTEKLFLTAYASLFYQRKFDFVEPQPLTISGIIGEREGQQNEVEIELAKRIPELNVGTEYGFYVRSKFNGKVVSAFHITGVGMHTAVQIWKCEFSKVSMQSPLYDFHLAALWDRQSLSEASDKVVEALNILEPIERLAFISVDQSNQRKPFVRLKTGEQLPLRTFGDGINRILHIVLSLVSSEKGFLLIDEFENGLHYAIQEKLWRMVFFLAEQLDVQVFATTHSSDAIKAFVDVISTQGNQQDGRIIHLQRRDGKIRAIDFNQAQAQTAVSYDLELR